MRRSSIRAKSRPGTRCATGAPVWCCRRIRSAISRKSPPSAGWRRLRHPDRSDLPGEAELAAAGRPVAVAVTLEDHVLGELGGLAFVPGKGLRLSHGERPAVALADVVDHRPGRELEGPEIAAAV